jgi:hypothetical protein
MLSAQFRQVAILDMLLTWWPLILVLIGGEILIHVYAAKEPEPKIKYDAFSIFIIMVIVFFSIGVYSLTATGVLERVTWMVESSIIPVEVPDDRIVIDEGIERLVVSAPRGKLNIKKSSNPEVVIFGEAFVNAADRDEAKSLVEQNRVVTHREGDTLFVQFLSNTWSGDFKPSIREIRHTILLPSDRNVEISGPNYFNLDIDGEALGNDWLIKGNGVLNITAVKESDLAISAQVKSPGHLGGNVNWETDETALSMNGGSVLKGQLKWGEGNNKVNIIIDGGELAVNEI